MNKTHEIIRNCTKGLGCTQSWVSLTPSKKASITGMDNIRHCSVCNQDVWWAENPAKLLWHIEQHHCVAIPWKYDLDGTVKTRTRPKIGAFKING